MTIAILAILFLSVALAVFWRPATALGIVFCNYGITQWAQSQDAYFIGNSILNYASSALLIFALAVKFFRGKPVFHGHSKIGFFTFALYAWAAISIIWTLAPGDASREWISALPRMVVFLIIAPLLISDEDDLRAGFNSTLAVGLITMLLLMFVSRWTGRSIMWAAAVWFRGERVVGGNPLAIASMAGSVVLIGMLMNFHGAARFWQVLRWFIVALGLAVSVRSGSRGQVLGTLAVAVVFLPISRRIRSIKGFFATALALLVFVGVAMWAFDQFGGGKRWQSEYIASDIEGGRFETARVLLSAWLQAGPVHWLIGLGSSASFSQSLLRYYAHVVPAEVLAETGLIGFAIYITVIVLMFKAMKRVYLNVVHDPVARGTFAALAGLLVFNLVLTLKQGSLLDFDLFMFAIMLARFDYALRHQWAPRVLPVDTFDPYSAYPLTV